METNNYNLENKVMPSFFYTIASSESHPLVSFQELERNITQDAMLKARTEDYRKRLEISKDYADEIKRMTPGISISAMMDGKGKQLANFLKPTYLMMLDFDHVPTEQLQEKMDLADADCHVKARYKTISGRGFRLFVSYSPIDDDEVSILELFSLMIRKVMRYYELLLGIKPDAQCTDITRMAGLAHDPDAYFNWEAEPFVADAKDFKTLYTQKANAAKSAKRISKKRRKQQVATPSTSKVSIEEAAPHIKQLLQQWGFVFEAGRHNKYMLQFGRVCVLYGIEKAEALSYASKEFGNDYDNVESVLKACYKHTDKLGLWHFYRPGEGYAANPSVKVIKQWLSSRYEFHQNTVTGFYEVRSRIIEKAKYLKWKQIDDNIANSIWSEMEEQGLSITIKKLHAIIESDFSEPFDPLEDYLRNLPQWDGKTDYIGQLADRIKIHEMPQELHTQTLFKYFFKKWFVAMVVAWVTLSVVSQTIMVFIGKGGIFKTTFFAYLLPPCLRPYFINESTACYTDKDFMEAFASKALLCLDEFESAFGKNLSAFKSCVTKLVFSIRRPYDKYRSEMPHRGALCATSNTVQIITDEENRRYSPWLIDSIQSPQDHPIDYEHIYAQAVALGKEVMERKASHQEGWVFWLTPEDIEVMREHNKPFMVSNFAEEQILRFYRVPHADTPSQFIKFRFTSEIMERIGGNPALSKNLNKHNLNATLKRLGFPKAHKENGNGWWVIEMDGAEINNNSLFDPQAKDELSNE